MRKVLSLLVACLLCLAVNNKANSMNFEEGIKQSKPMALYLYADWADDSTICSQVFFKLSQQYSDKYNFITLNIASADAKAFNKMYHIYPNLPYVLLFRDGVKFSRYINTECVKDTSCFKDKLELFIN